MDLDAKSFILQELAKGSGEQDIRSILQSSGYSKEEIDQAYADALSSKENESNWDQGVLHTSDRGLPGATHILREAIAEYRVHWGRYLGVIFLSFLIYLPVGIGAFFVISFGSAFAFSLMQNVFVTIVIILLALIGVVVANMVFAWGRIALEYSILNRSENVGVFDSLRDTFRKIPQYFWINFLQGIVTFSILVLFFALSSFAVFLSSLLNVSKSIINLGSLIGIIIGIAFACVFLVWFSFSTYIYLVEKEQGARALLKSREYVRGIWLGVFGRLLYIFVIFGGLYLIIQLLARFSSDAASSLLTLFLALIFLVFSPILVVYLCILYTYVRQLKGEMSFQPTRKGTWLVNGVGILAILLPVLAIVLVAVTLPSQKLSVPNDVEIEKERLDFSTPSNSERSGFSAPLRQGPFAQANDTQRRSDITAIANSLAQYKVDNGAYPPGLSYSDFASHSAVFVEIGKGVGFEKYLDLCSVLVPAYISALPADPLLSEDRITDCDQDHRTGYYVFIDENGRITIEAKNAEVDEKISVTR